MVIKELDGMPVKSGHYFIKENGKNYWSALIRLGGKAPFLDVISIEPLFKSTDDNPNLSTCIFSEALELEPIIK